MYGLLNGSMFRRFSYRQVAMLGALLVVLGLYFTSIGDSFTSFLITFSVIYGAGMGLNASANSLALNTYFKENRRTATGLSWTTTGLGPIVMPYIVNILLNYFGFQGTLLLFSGLAMHAFVCALLYQPVQWHVKRPDPLNVEELHKEPDYQCRFCRLKNRKSRSLLSSQYLYNADDWNSAGYEIIDPGIPMMSETNDGYFTPRRSFHNSRQSLVGKLDSLRASSQNLSTSISNRPSYANLASAISREKKKSSTIRIEEHPVEDNNCIQENNSKLNSLRGSSQNLSLSNRPIGASNTERREKKKSTTVRIEEHPTEDCPSFKAPQDISNEDRGKLSVNGNAISEAKYLLDNHSCASYKHHEKLKRANTFNTEREVLKIASQKLEEYVNESNETKPLKLQCTCDEDKRLLAALELVAHEEVEPTDTNCDKKLTFIQKVTVFFDLDLLKDFTYVNLMVGITVANFAELNFSILTPFVLRDFGFSQQQIAFVMSLLGAMDISVRFFIPFVAGKIGFENTTFFLFGVFGMAIGRVVLAHFRSYTVVLIAAAWIGLNKGLRTIFMALVIPSYVPLDRLPAASGLQLAFAGIFYLLMGPVVGWVRDATDYTFTLHFLNLATYFTVISWVLEKIYRNRKEAAKSKLLS